MNSSHRIISLLVIVLGIQGFKYSNRLLRINQLHFKQLHFKLESLQLYVSPRIEIEYCTGCRWMLRSAWLGQELLTTFQDDIGEVALIPQREVAGTFIVRVNNKVIWDRKNEDTKGFPEAKKLKQLVRNEITPQKDLGHSDVKKSVISSLSNDQADSKNNSLDCPECESKQET
mmetsp:Transcript_3991/g.4075  ORF Transcript_3991/g.4075 Transcript_3991/m.4075 type:complete len:173 (+) Transcript_3991:75-593(+)